MKKSSSDCSSSSKSFTMISFHAILFLCIAVYLGMYTDIHLQTSWFGLSAPSTSTSTSPTPSSSSPTTLELYMSSPRSFPWFTSVLRSMDDLDSATDTLHTWRRQYFTPSSHCILSHAYATAVNSTSDPSSTQRAATHHDHDDHIHINDTGNDIIVWKKRIDTFQHGIEMAQANIQMEKDDGMTITAQHQMVISHITQLCNDVIEHLSLFPLQLSSDLTSITSHLTSTHDIITSSIHSFTWTHDRDMIENMIDTWRGKGSYVKYQYLKHTFIAQMMNLLQPWKILFDRQHHGIPAPLTSPYMTTDDEIIVRPILSHLTTQLHHYVQQFIDNVIPHITSDIHHPIDPFEYENILMILYMSHELFPRQQHPVTHVTLSSYINHITTLNYTRMRMIHTYDEMMKKQDDNNIQQFEMMLEKMHHIQQIRMITQEIATTTPTIIPIPIPSDVHNDNDDSKSQSQLTAPAYMMWQKALIQAQDNVTGIQTQLEHLQAIKQDLSNHVTSQTTHIQSFTSRITSLRDIININIQHMNGTLDTIMSYATWSEQYIIYAQQYVETSHAWMIQQQIWYTTWIKQLDSSITSLTLFLSRYQHRISILHHIYDTCLSMWQHVISPIDIAIHDALTHLPQLDMQWNEMIHHAQQHIDTSTYTLQEQIQQTEEEWKHAQKQPDVSVTASLSSQLSMLREQLQDVKIEQEMWNKLAKTSQEKKEDGNDNEESHTSHSSTSNTLRIHSQTV